MKNNYEIIVSNIGRAHVGHNLAVALRELKEYREACAAPHGRAGGEVCELLRNGEPFEPAARVRARKPSGYALACIAAESDARPMQVLSVDAWRDNGGWSWNNWFNAGTIPAGWMNQKPRDILRYMRAANYLSAQSAGRLAVEDDQHNLVIVAKGTREPLFALVYGDVPESK